MSYIQLFPLEFWKVTKRLVVLLGVPVLAYTMVFYTPDVHTYSLWAKIASYILLGVLIVIAIPAILSWIFIDPFLVK
ncbi:hypothetical protein [Sporosarcina sp. FSL W7-1283]|uniref:hypothetical protein n=1 Tax=Sporosarcina sp. FSL W7-1283 TaxID=2921560 RepID=UPI0030F4CD40